ncbi:MAG: HU family DNA-binding protein [Methylovulum sp.]|nr:HU family DNA-binding protein [Methylovulum sp.]
MKAIEIVEIIKQSNANLLGKLTDKEAAKILSLAFAELGKQLGSTTEGPIKIPGLGVFKIKQVEREKEGQKVTVKRIGFRTMKARVKAKKSAE